MGIKLVRIGIRSAPKNGFIRCMTRLTAMKPRLISWLFDNHKMFMVMPACDPQLLDDLSGELTRLGASVSITENDVLPHVLLEMHLTYVTHGDKDEALLWLTYNAEILCKSLGIHCELPF